MKQLVLGILAHVDAGKTTLSEALLYRTGAIRDLGRVDHKNAHLDTHALERARGITIFSRQARLPLGGHAARHAGPRGLFCRDGAHAAGARLCRARHQRHGRRAGAHGNALAAAAALPRAGVCVRDEDGPAGRGPCGAHGRPARAPERRVCGLHRPRPGADRPVRRGGARAVS